MSDELIIKKFIADLVKKNIKLVCFDMDMTLTSDHSGGLVTKKSLKRFLDSVPEFVKKLMGELTSKTNAHINVAIVTYADDYYGEIYPGDNYSGKKLVHALLGSFLSPDKIGRVTIICLNSKLYNDKSYDKNREREKFEFYRKKIESFGIKENNKDFFHYPPLPYKNEHFSILKYMYGLEYKQMILLDDCQDNVMGAKKIGCSAIHIDNESGIQRKHLKIENTSS